MTDTDTQPGADRGTIRPYARDARQVSIRSGGPVGHLGTERWAVETICAMSRLDVEPTEVTILVAVDAVCRGDLARYPLRYVLSGGSILGSYRILDSE